MFLDILCILFCSKEKHKWILTLYGKVTKFTTSVLPYNTNNNQLVQSDPRDVTPVMMYTKVDAQCDKPATVDGRTKVTTPAKIYQL